MLAHAGHLLKQRLTGLEFEELVEMASQSSPKHPMLWDTFLAMGLLASATTAGSFNASFRSGAQIPMAA